MKTEELAGRTEAENTAHLLSEVRRFHDLNSSLAVLLGHVVLHGGQDREEGDAGAGVKKQTGAVSTTIGCGTR